MAYIIIKSPDLMAALAANLNSGGGVSKECAVIAVNVLRNIIAVAKDAGKRAITDCGLLAGLIGLIGPDGNGGADDELAILAVGVLREVANCCREMSKLHGVVWVQALVGILSRKR